MLLKASSGKRCAPRNFVTLGCTLCSPHRVLRRIPNEIDYGKINVETNSGTVVSTKRPHWHGDIKVGLSPSKKFCFICFKNDEKCFWFHLKSSFRSQDIYFFILTFWSCRKNGLIRKIRLISKFMTSQPGQQTITIHILPNVSRSKGNQAMKFG